MIIALITVVMSIVGIYSFFIGNYMLTFIAGALIFLELLRGIATGQLKSLKTTIFASFLGIIFVRDFWIGIALGLCFENLIMVGFSIPLFLSYMKATK